MTYSITYKSSFYQKSFSQLALLIGLSILPFAVFSAVPDGYPADYQKIIDDANEEGKVVIYATTDTKTVQPLIKDFNTLYPGIQVEYNDMNSTEIYNRFISEQAAGGASGDLVWNSSMDSGIKLATDFAMTYESPEVKHLPNWANYDNKAFGTTFEPVVIVYNKTLVPKDDVPRNLAELGKLIANNQETFKNKVTTYDIEKSAVGFMLAVQDNIHHPDYFGLMKDLGSANLVVQSSVGTMLERISSGEMLIGYNLLGPYAEIKAKTDPALGIVYSDEYTLIVSRVAFISEAGEHPNAAKLWLDYLLSARGQALIADSAQLGAIRDDIPGPNGSKAITERIPGQVKPIPIDDSLLAFLEQTKRLNFINQWRDATNK
ncbi:ABC transporter substrate-binding protein [Thorsellia anophelis]|uniref:Iron(III) transport system substrate-binding protein n=1 Tax=Thorsellia anophelis DSM 18579 TaxID=1123402 RepID=A0A1I0AEV5_9GAMM|nr:ABC transporter substrate-binding protein [Thorsellia anophelis]SES92782.1 iron(III) transport system substrate-binding protein [Thorsellia anophelis DSM 18579]